MFESPSAADIECKKMADAAKLSNPESFVAWLSFPDNPISARMPHKAVKYVRSDGAPVAESWDDLVDGQIASPIRKDEAGMEASAMSTVAWTPGRSSSTGSAARARQPVA